MRLPAVRSRPDDAVNAQNGRTHTVHLVHVMVPDPRCRPRDVKEVPKEGERRRSRRERRPSLRREKSLAYVGQDAYMCNYTKIRSLPKWKICAKILQKIHYDT